MFSHAVTGDWREDFYLAFQMSNHPFDVHVIPVEQSSMDEGRRVYQLLLAEWEEFVETGVARNPIGELESIGIPEQMIR